MNTVVISYNHFESIIKALLREQEIAAICSVGVNKLHDGIELLVHSFDIASVKDITDHFSPYSNKLAICYTNKVPNISAWENIRLEYYDLLFNPSQWAYTGVLQFGKAEGIIFPMGFIIEPGGKVKTIHQLEIFGRTVIKLFTEAVKRDTHIEKDKILRRCKVRRKRRRRRLRAD
ncbi:MAG: hypothetical protein SCARUB_01157 [Candidatus Scalindua rubra]|uniref:Uncharacterized protein n=1 Tax=Candidatus Scalindua rubra TaxID=1872076 RepID=A0A1E3XDR1_9BACT|nr:MAG: hypothetical protein SCARUB_01157 [Candidatus Scalindua rubra]